MLHSSSIKKRKMVLITVLVYYRQVHAKSLDILSKTCFYPYFETGMSNVALCVLRFTFKDPTLDNVSIAIGQCLNKVLGGKK
ncbi:hypothetical protein GGS24DRAFT_472036 [Hypoxylon argillaceum]|nr:hypothetical protein GGS24DRAFT_472036 [Hypoxylon argillaceum]KAI1154828.1 hypothetical protein F4825DRAFT_409995 [Nemania diffusa]